MESFNDKVCKTYQGRALVILRPLIEKKKGVVTLRAEGNNLESGEVSIIIK